MTSSIFENAVFGPLFGDAETSRLFGAEVMIDHMMRFEIAYADALGKTGVVPADMASRAVEAMLGFSPDMPALAAQTRIDGLPVPELVRQIREHCDADLSAAIHSGATSQDVLDTSLALSLRLANDRLEARLAGVLERLGDLLAAHADRPLMGRTRMQAALPIRVGDRLRNWVVPLTRHLARLSHLRTEVEQLQFGGPVGTRDPGTGADVARHLARALGLSNPDHHWHTDRSGLASYGNWLSLVTGGLGKIGQDIALMAQQGIDEVAMESGGTSSAMPHKQNPVLAELLVTLARYNAVQLSGLHQAMVHEQERSGAAWALEWMILPQMVETTASALGAADRLLGQITRIGSA